VIAGVDAGPATIDAPYAGAAVLDDAPGSVEALPADSLESAVQDQIASVARLTINAAINNTLTSRMVKFF
jgi:hypothetical protein